LDQIKVKKGWVVYENGGPSDVWQIRHRMKEKKENSFQPKSINIYIYVLKERNAFGGEKAMV
jgi:hypothetical protein